MNDSEKQTRDIIYRYILMAAGLYLSIKSLSILMQGVLFGAIMNFLSHWGYFDNGQYKSTSFIPTEAKIRLAVGVAALALAAFVGIVPGLLFFLKMRVPNFLKGLLQSERSANSTSCLCGSGLLLISFCFMVDCLQSFLRDLVYLIFFRYTNSAEISGGESGLNMLVNFHTLNLAPNLILLLAITGAMFIIKKQMQPTDKHEDLNK